MRSLIEELQALKTAMNTNQSRLAIGVYKVRVHCHYRKLLHEIDNYIPKDNK